jgi:hypothetical protein
MTTTISITQTIFLPPDRKRDIKVDVELLGCRMYCTSPTAASQYVFGTWEQINDPEWMYEAFKYEYLVVFKALADILGRVIENKQTHLDMLA